ncbi:MAG: GntR family transcriptional regulator, partial [Planctomycetes bacterium]|nr:GntR family transcriptional regulator [Planctomycetota bacterium]
MAATVASRDCIDRGKPETVVEAITEKLIRYIAEHRLKGGDRLPSERDLARMVGASRLPLREAVCVLKGLGIVEARHGKGIFVKQLDPTAVFGMLSPLLRTQAEIDVQHIFEVRLHLEAGIAELAAAHRSEQNLEQMRDALCGMRASIQKRRNYARHDMAFHQELASSTGNPVFRVFMASITDLLSEV